MDGRIDYLEKLTMERRPWRLRVCAVRVWKQPNHGKDLGFGDCFEMDIVDQCVSKLYPTISIYVFPAPTSITVCQFRQLLYRFKSSPPRSLPLCATATIHHHVYHIFSYHFRLLTNLLSSTNMQQDTERLCFCFSTNVVRCIEIGCPRSTSIIWIIQVTRGIKYLNVNHLQSDMLMNPLKA